MKRCISLVLAILLTITFLSACTNSEKIDAGGNEMLDQQEEKTDDNESIKQQESPKFKEVSVHDPSIIKTDDTYYVFGSHIDAAKSTDLMSWTKFTNGYTTPGNTLYGDLSKNLAESFAWAGENDSDCKVVLPFGLLKFWNKLY